MSKTIHGCTCKEEWSFAPGGKKHKGCVIGGPDNALCPLTEDPDKVKESCKGSSHSRPYCVVKEKNCGWVKEKDSGLQDGGGTDWCDWSLLPFGAARNSPPLVFNPRRYYIGLVVYIIIYTFIIPWIFYATNKLYLLSALLPNYHLFAPALSSINNRQNSGNRGPSIFSFLVVSDTSPSSVAIISSKILDLCSLLGLVYVVVLQSLNKDIIYGISYGVIILIMTHMLGGFIISKVCTYLYYRVLTYPRTHWTTNTRALISALGGVLVAFLLIFVEAQVLKKLRIGYISRILTNIVNYIN